MEIGSRVKVVDVRYAFDKNLLGQEGTVVSLPDGVFKCYVNLDNFNEDSYPFMSGEVEEI